MPLVKILNALGGEGKCGAGLSRAFCCRRLDLVRLEAEFRRAQIKAVETGGIFQQGGVAARPHVGDDFRHLCAIAARPMAPFRQQCGEFGLEAG